ncbi:MAG: hypothetical protein LAQ30_23110 [Acidobacteriia bacterium]|nr:hypothetical protein [Terriglobia bacterium]
MADLSPEAGRIAGAQAAEAGAIAGIAQRLSRQVAIAQAERQPGDAVERQPRGHPGIAG